MAEGSTGRAGSGWRGTVAEADVKDVAVLHGVYQRLSVLLDQLLHRRPLRTTRPPPPRQARLAQLLALCHWRAAAGRCQCTWTKTRTSSFFSTSPLPSIEVVLWYSRNLHGSGSINMDGNEPKMRQWACFATALPGAAAATQRMRKHGHGAWVTAWATGTGERVRAGLMPWGSGQSKNQSGHARLGVGTVALTRRVWMGRRTAGSALRRSKSCRRPLPFPLPLSPPQAGSAPVCQPGWGVMLALSF